MRQGPVSLGAWRVCAALRALGDRVPGLPATTITVALFPVTADCNHGHCAFLHPLVNRADLNYLVMEFLSSHYSFHCISC